MQNVSTPVNRWLMLTCYGSFVLLGANLVLIPSLIRSIERFFGQSDRAFGLFYLVGALCYATGALTGGLLTERFGRRMVLTAGVLSIGLGLIGDAFTPVWGGLFVAALFVGWGGGVVDSGINALVLDLYRDARGGALSRLHLFFGVGSFIAPVLFGQLLAAAMPWRTVILLVAVPLLMLALPLARLPMPLGRHEPQASGRASDALDASERSLLPFIGLALSIALYVAAEIAVTNWLVKLLVTTPVATATAVLSLFWGGLALGRLLSNWVAERLDYFLFTIICALLASVALIGAVLTRDLWLPVPTFLFAVAGMFYGPIYPMIMAIGGNIYPRRLAALSGGLASAAVAGSTIYPPLMGLMAASIGLPAGMIGAAVLGVPLAALVWFVRQRQPQSRAAAPSVLPPEGASACQATQPTPPK